MITSRHIQPNSFWGLVKQSGPWKTTSTDLTHEAKGYDSPHNQVQEVRPFQQNGSAAPTYTVTPIIQPDRIENFRGVGLQRERTGQGLGERLATLFKDLQGEQAPQFAVKPATNADVDVDAVDDDDDDDDDDFFTASSGASSPGIKTETDGDMNLTVQDYQRIFPNQEAWVNPRNVPPMLELEFATDASRAANIENVVPQTLEAFDFRAREARLAESLAPRGPHPVSARRAFELERVQERLETDPLSTQEAIKIVTGSRSMNLQTRADALKLRFDSLERQRNRGEERALTEVLGSDVPFDAIVYEDYIQRLRARGVFTQPDPELPIPIEIIEMQRDAMMEPPSPLDSIPPTSPFGNLNPFGFALPGGSQGSLTASSSGSGSSFDPNLRGVGLVSGASLDTQARSNVLPSAAVNRLIEGGMSSREARASVRRRRSSAPGGANVGVPGVAPRNPNLRVRTTSVGRGLRRLSLGRQFSSPTSMTPSPKSNKSDASFVPSDTSRKSTP